VALGLLVLGLGAFWFGYLVPLWRPGFDLNTAMYGSLLARTIGTACFAVALLQDRPPPLPARLVAPLLLAFGGACLAVTLGGEGLPRLVELANLEAAAADDGHAMLDGLTAWHWGLSFVPLTLGVAAAVGPPGTGPVRRWAAGWWWRPCSSPAPSCTPCSGRRPTARS
jgi:hypothetical protein